MGSHPKAGSRENWRRVRLIGTGVWLLSFFLLLAGVVVIIKSADLLVDGAVGLSRRFGVSELVVGLTVCAFGTSAPELFVNGAASLADRDALVLGNVLGSNIFNTLLVLGVGSLIFPLRVTRSTLRWELPIGLLALGVFLGLANDAWFGSAKSVLSRGDGLVLLTGFALFIGYVFTLGGGSNTEDVESTTTTGKSAIYVAIGLVGLPVAAHLVVQGATGVALAAGLSEEMVGLTIVSAGTSFPELAATSAAAWRRRPDLAVGNVVGSNIFNLLLVLGVSSSLAPIDHLAALNADGLVFAAASAVVLLSVWWRGCLSRVTGATLVTGFLAYLAFLSARDGILFDLPKF